MEEPKIAQKGPYGVTLKPGKYSWCACGLSNDQPFCDGSHKKTGFRPVIFEIQEEQEVWLCGCKHTDTKPFCNGNHSKLD